MYEPCHEWKCSGGEHKFPCLLQCDRKEYFIEKIKEMDFEVQTQLVPYIQEVCAKMRPSLLVVLLIGAFPRLIISILC